VPGRNFRLHVEKHAGFCAPQESETHCSLRQRCEACQPGVVSGIGRL